MMNKLLAFLYGLLANLKIPLIGQLGGNEILSLIGIFNIHLVQRLFKLLPELKKINIGYLVFLLAQIISDIYNNIPLEDRARGCANIFMAIVCTNFIAYQFIKNNKNIILYLIGYVITQIFFGRNDDQSETLQDMGFFKFVLVPVLNSILLIISWYVISKHRNAEKIILVFFVGYAMFNLAFDSRSNAVIFIILTALYYYRYFLRKLSIKTLTPYFILFLILFQSLYSIYVYNVLNGNIGGEHTKMQLSQTINPYNPLNLLMEGRSEVYAGFVAATDAPLLGHGSWAVDRGGRYKFIVFQLHNDEERYKDYNKIETIPSHSVIIGAWMYGGLAALLSILYIIYVFYTNVFYIIKNARFVNSSFIFIILYFAVNFAWTAMFSPLPHIKQTFPPMIAFVIIYSAKLKTKRKLR